MFVNHATPSSFALVLRPPSVCFPASRNATTIPQANQDRCISKMRQTKNPLTTAYKNLGINLMQYNTSSIIKYFPRSLPQFAALIAAVMIICPPKYLQAQTFYVSADNNIDKVTATGLSSVFATLPSGSNPTGVAFDSAGNLYVAENATAVIAKITPAGVVSTFATLAATSYSPNGLAFDSSGNLYVADTGIDQISKITPSGTISTFGFLPSGSHAPVGLAFDSSGNLYVTDQTTNQITKFTLTGTASTFASLASGTRPAGLTIDGSGNLYAVGQSTSVISKITPGGVVSTFSTLPSNSVPDGIASDGIGNLYVADFNTSQISKLNANGVVSTFASNISDPGFIAYAPGTVPEPSTWLLLAISGILVLTMRRQRRVRCSND